MLPISRLDLVASLHDLYTSTHPKVTIETACKLHSQGSKAFEQFKILADKAEPDADANLYVGRYLIDSRIQVSHGTGRSAKDLNVRNELFGSSKRFGIH